MRYRIDPQTRKGHEPRWHIELRFMVHLIPCRDNGTSRRIHQLETITCLLFVMFIRMWFNSLEVYSSKYIYRHVGRE